MSIISLTNQFLIAMPQLEDPNFFHSVTYICQHNADGALGIVINRPIDMKLGEVFDHLEIETHDQTIRQQPIYFGGPVQAERGFVLHRPDKIWENTMLITNNIALTTSRDILNDIAQQKGPEKSLIALGYAGWGTGQLEQEMAENAWLSVEATPNIIFDLPYEKRWQTAASLLGIDLTLLSEEIGHA